MSLTDTVTRSVPMNPDGTPRDPSLRLVPRHVAASDPGTPREELPPEIKAALDHAPSQPAPADAPEMDPVLASVAHATPQPATKPAAEPRVRYIGAALLEKTFNLDFPIAVDDVEYRSLTLRVITGKAFEPFTRYVSEGSNEQEAILAIIAGVDPFVIRSLYVDDRVELWDAALPFVPRKMRLAFEAAMERANAETPPDSPNTPTTPAS